VLLDAARNWLPAQQQGAAAHPAAVPLPDGAEAATVPAIAERAGASVGAVYRRFPDKDALLRAVCERFLERIETPSKNWKFSAHDVQERSCWRAYMAAFQDMIQHTATADSPWYVVPADHKWFARLVVAGVVVETLAGLDLQFPRLDRARRKELEVAGATLVRER